MTAHTYHFMAGLPRSGSNLLAALLLQNPDFYASMTSPAIALVGPALQVMSNKNENKVFFDDARRAQIVRGLFDGYYYDRAPIVVDTSRTWPTYFSTLATVFPDCRMVCCIRPVEWVQDSFERIYQTNAFKSFAWDIPSGIYERCALTASPEGPLGRAMAALREAVYGPHSRRIMLLRYNTLADWPGEAMRAVYDWLGAPRFHGHDFRRVEFSGGQGYDAAQGMPGMHDVRPVVERIPRQTILPPDLFEQYKAFNFWDTPGAVPEHIQIV